MKKWLWLVLFGFFMLPVTALPGLAADSWHQFSARDAQSGSLGKAKLTPNVKLFMKGEAHPKVVKTLGEFKSNQRTNGFGKSAQVACDTAFISALIALQGRAEKEGGNAVIDIFTITKDKPFESAEQYSCIKGGFVTNVALKGTVAILVE